MTPNSAHDEYHSVDRKGRGVERYARIDDGRIGADPIKYSAGFNYENKVSARLEKFALRRLHTRSRRLLLLPSPSLPLESNLSLPPREGQAGERRVKIPSSLRRVSNKVPSLRFLLRIPANLRGSENVRRGLDQRDRAVRCNYSERRDVSPR